jgi:hypothetical protein
MPVGSLWHAESPGSFLPVAGHRPIIQPVRLVRKPPAGGQDGCQQTA